MPGIFAKRMTLRNIVINVFFLERPYPIAAMNVADGIDAEDRIIILELPGGEGIAGRIPVCQICPRQDRTRKTKTQNEQDQTAPKHHGNKIAYAMILRQMG